jgi:serine/threonine-protein kinase RsbW
VAGHQMYCPAEPVRLSLTDLAGRFEVEVTDTCGSDSPRSDSARSDSARSDSARAGDAPAGDRAAGHDGYGSVAGLPAGLGIAVIEGLADDVQIRETPAGTSIKMSWPSAGARR